MYIGISLQKVLAEKTPFNIDVIDAIHIIRLEIDQYVIPETSELFAKGWSVKVPFPRYFTHVGLYPFDIF
jgi:hypothetical protein